MLKRRKRVKTGPDCIIKHPSPFSIITVINTSFLDVSRVLQPHVYIYIENDKLPWLP